MGFFFSCVVFVHLSLVQDTRKTDLSSSFSCLCMCYFMCSPYYKKWCSSVCVMTFSFFLFPLHTPLVLFPVYDSFTLKVAWFWYVYRLSHFDINPTETKPESFVTSPQLQACLGKTVPNSSLFRREALELITRGEIAAADKECLTCCVHHATVLFLHDTASCKPHPLFQKRLGGLNVNCLISPISHSHFCYTQCTYTQTHTNRETPCCLKSHMCRWIKGEKWGGHTHMHTLLRTNPSQGEGFVCMSLLMSVCGCLCNGAACLLISVVTQPFNCPPKVGIMSPLPRPPPSSSPPLLCSSTSTFPHPISLGDFCF